MDQERFAKADNLAEDINEYFQKHQEDPDMIALKAQLQALVTGLDVRYSANIMLTLHVFDSKRGKTIDIFGVGLNAQPEGEPYLVTESDSFARYIVNGSITEIPHSYCPVCWAKCVFMKKGQECSSCGSSYGRNIKLLADNNECPNCLKGVISQEKPTCPECNFYADPDLVIWG